VSVGSNPHPSQVIQRLGNKRRSCWLKVVDWLDELGCRVPLLLGPFVSPLSNTIQRNSPGVTSLTNACPALGRGDLTLLLR
jgi:hypothetical protein